MPRWARSVAALLAAYGVIMAAAALWMPHEWDWAVFEWLSSHHAPTFSQQVAIVDVPWDTADVAGDRRNIARVLDRLVGANEHPAAVILDVEFAPCQATNSIKKLPAQAEPQPAKTQ